MAKICTSFRSLLAGQLKTLMISCISRVLDLAIISSDSLEEYKSQVPDIQRRLTYILNLFPSELHVFARPEIRSLQDLAGKKVNFNTLGTAAAFSGPLIFSRMGLNVEKMFIPAPGGAGTNETWRDLRRRVHHVKADRRLPEGTMGPWIQIPAGQL